MPPPLDWLSWELWFTAVYAVLSGPRWLAARVWAEYVANRAHLVPIATVLGAVAIAWAALRQAKTATLRHVEQTTADRERRITESFAKAGEHLGSDKRETRLVGIYTLERIAGEKESEREYWPIMETLTAFVRERAPWPPKDVTKRTRPPTDIQAVLTVLGRRNKTAPEQYREERTAGRRLDLAATHLDDADLTGAHLEGANLNLAHLENADLFRAHLQRAGLNRAHLQGAHLQRAHLQGANLWGRTWKAPP